MRQHWISPKICKLIMIGRRNRLAWIYTHSYTIKPGGKPTMGMSSENIMISNTPKHLWRSGKIEKLWFNNSWPLMVVSFRVSCFAVSLIEPCALSQIRISMLFCLEGIFNKYCNCIICMKTMLNIYNISFQKPFY